MALSTPDFEAWYAENHARLAATLAVSSGDLDLARECTDEAFARALERWQRVRAMDQPEGWVYRVALNDLRRRARRRSVERSLLRREHQPGTVDATDPRHPVWEAVGALPERMRTAVALRYVADLTELQVAEAMGIARGTVAATLHEARRRLGAFLQPDSDEEVVPHA